MPQRPPHSGHLSFLWNTATRHRVHDSHFHTTISRMQHIFQRHHTSGISTSRHPDISTTRHPHIPTRPLLEFIPLLGAAASRDKQAKTCGLIPGQHLSPWSIDDGPRHRGSRLDFFFFLLSLVSPVSLGFLHEEGYYILWYRVGKEATWVMG